SGDPAARLAAALSSQPARGRHAARHPRGHHLAPHRSPPRPVHRLPQQTPARAGLDRRRPVRLHPHGDAQPAARRPAPLSGQPRPAAGSSHEEAREEVIPPAPMNLPRSMFSMRFTITALLVSCTVVLSPGNSAAQIERTLKGHANTITCVAFAPDGKSLASGGKDGTAIVWDVAGGGGRRKPTGAKGG